MGEILKINNKSRLSFSFLLVEQKMNATEFSEDVDEGKKKKASF